MHPSPATLRTTNRADALSIAAVAHQARVALPFSERVWMETQEEQARFGYKHGWYIVGEHSISTEEITGEAYDMHQGGWAWV